VSKQSHEYIDMKGAGWPLGPSLAVVAALFAVPVVGIIVASGWADRPEQASSAAVETLSAQGKAEAAADAAQNAAAAAADRAAAEVRGQYAVESNRDLRPSLGMTDADVNRLTTYAVALGRGSACGVDTSDAGSRVGAWIDAKMPAGSGDRRLLFPIFMQGVQSHAQEQASGQSPDSCEAVARQFAMMPWP